MNKIGIALMLSAAIILSGCETFQVKNTDGLKSAFVDADMALSKASQLKSIKDISEKQRQQAADDYRQAKSSLNGYMEGIILDASSLSTKQKYTVNADEASYKKTKSSERVAAFATNVDKLQGIKFHPYSFITLTPVDVGAAIKDIVQLNNQKAEKAYNRFVTIVKSKELPNYEEVSAGKSNK